MAVREPIGSVVEQRQGDRRFLMEMRVLMQSADTLQETVTERRKLLAHVAVMERRIERTQQETARILGGLIKG